MYPRIFIISVDRLFENWNFVYSCFWSRSWKTSLIYTRRKFQFNYILNLEFEKIQKLSREFLLGHDWASKINNAIARETPLTGSRAQMEKNIHIEGHRQATDRCPRHSTKISRQVREIRYLTLD